MAYPTKEIDGLSEWDDEHVIILEVTPLVDR